MYFQKECQCLASHNRLNESMIALLSPAKRLKNTEELVEIECSIPKFLPQAREINSVLRKKSVNALMKLQGISKELASNNWERNQIWSGSEENRGWAAIYLFDGEVYRGLAAEHWNEDNLVAAQKRIRVISGLYGLLSPLDRVEPYRLEMGTQIRIKTKSNLYEFWRKRLTDELVEISNNQPILELCSTEYSKVFDKKRLGMQMHQVEFLESKGDSKPKAIQVYLKQARGMMASFIIKNEIKDLNDIRAFDWEGYNFDNNLSSERKSVFIRYQSK
jgi:uncharacterized protein